jgi:hypothetical protein
MNVVKFFFSHYFIKVICPLLPERKIFILKILPPHEKRRGRRKNSRWIVMSTTPARALMDLIREECGLPWLLSTLIFFVSICSLMA